VPRLPDWSDDEERFQESKRAANDAVIARRAARKALRDGNPALAQASVKVYDSLVSTALKLAQAGPRRRIRQVSLPTEDEVRAKRDAQVS
jgi:hypothetical protein